MAKNRKNRRSASSKQRFIGKPAGKIQERVEQAGPVHFGVIAVDCAKRRSKWMLCNFYGKVLVDATSVDHNRGGLQAMMQQIKKAIQTEGLNDSIVAVEMTGIYHRPIYQAFRKAGFDTRIVHPFASKHYRQPLHPDLKTDDNDLDAIFHAAINGYGLTLPPVGEIYQSIQAVSRHRLNLVTQRSRLMVQIRRLLHQTMPGYADLFPVSAFFRASVAMPVALRFSSADVIREQGVGEIIKALRSAKHICQTRTIERLFAWAETAVEPSELAHMDTRHWQQLNEVRELLTRQIDATERELAGFLVKTPYVLLLSVTGINVVSAARLAGEAGPIENYASSRAITGRAGLYPSRYQSDEVDHADGALVRQCNRRLRGAAILIADNLIKCHSYYRSKSALWKLQKVDPRDRRCRIANRAMRMVFQLVSGRQVWRGQGVDREYLLAKLQEFHRLHKTPLEQVLRDMNEAFVWLPKSAYAGEAKPLAELVKKKHRGPKRIGDLLMPLLIRLGVTNPDEVELTESEARSPD